MTNNTPAGTQCSKSSHSASWTHQCSHLTLNGIPPLLEGDTHLCLLTQPSAHPQLPCRKPNRKISVNGRQWIGAGDFIDCLGPCRVLDGCMHVFFGQNNITNTGKTPESHHGLPFSL